MSDLSVSEKTASPAKSTTMADHHHDQEEQDGNNDNNNNNKMIENDTSMSLLSDVAAESSSVSNRDTDKQKNAASPSKVKADESNNNNKEKSIKEDQSNNNNNTNTISDDAMTVAAAPPPPPLVPFGTRPSALSNPRDKLPSADEREKSTSKRRNESSTTNNNSSSAAVIKNKNNNNNTAEDQQQVGIAETSQSVKKSSSENDVAGEEDKDVFTEEPPPPPLGFGFSTSANHNNNKQRPTSSSSLPQQNQQQQQRPPSTTSSSSNQRPQYSTSSSNINNNNNKPSGTPPLPVPMSSASSGRSPPQSADSARNEAMLERRGLKIILSEFVKDCVNEGPNDILSYMIEWATVKRNQTTHQGISSVAAVGSPNSSGIHTSTTTIPRPPSSSSSHPNNNGSSPRMNYNNRTNSAGGATTTSDWNDGAATSSSSAAVPKLSPWSQTTSNGPTTNNNNNSGSPNGANNNNNNNANTSSSQQRPGTVNSQRSGHSGTNFTSSTTNNPQFISLVERPPSQGHTLRRLTCVILGAEKSNKEQLLAMLDTLAPTEEYNFGPKMSPALRDLLGTVKDKTAAAGVTNAALVPCESDKMDGCVVFADLPSHQLSPQLISLTSLADLVCLCVSAKHGLADINLKRQGELYSRVLLAHSVGVKRAVVVITDIRGTSPTDVETVEKEVRHMFGRCGFDDKLIKIVRGTNSSDILFGAIGSVKTQSKMKYVMEPTKKMKATMIVLQPPGIKSGDVLDVYSLGHFKVKVDSIPTLIDRKTNQVTDTDIAILKLNQVASIHVSVMMSGQQQQQGENSSSSVSARSISGVVNTAVSAPIVAYSKGKVIAMGNIAEIIEKPSIMEMKRDGNSLIRVDEEDVNDEDDDEDD